MGEPLGQLPLSIAGAPTIELPEDALTASDDAGALALALVTSVADDAEGEPVRRWAVGRATTGSVQVSYLARPIADEPRSAPPLELRREGTGLSGAVKGFLVLPPGPEDLAFELQWVQPAGQSNTGNWMAVTSLGEGTGDDSELAGAGLELLGDTYVMCGDLTERHHRDGQMSTWWLTTPGFDVAAFTAYVGRTYQVMSEAFAAPAHPYRVFLRAHPHRGANASAHPASFVMAMNPANPLDVSKVDETIAHELVHEWLHLDGPEHEATWFNEGSADYYSLVVPLREGILDEAAFLHAINQESRTGYASPRRHLTMQEATPLFFTDVLAHRLPYVRGMFYLADLDGRLRIATSGRQSVDDIVRDVVRRRRDGERIGIRGWCARVDEVLRGDELQALESLVLTGAGRPGPGTFAPRFEMTEVDVPVLDVGFDFSTFVTRRVEGLVPGGPAERAGLAEGDEVELPSYTEALSLNTDDVLSIRATRDGETILAAIPLCDQTTAVPQWHRQRATGGR
ncbi:MAG: hypothetical protein ACR2K3_02965 [Nocardioides sp.]